MVLQAVLFPKKAFTKKEANKWLKEHNIKKMKPLHETENEYRARIMSPNKKGKYYSNVLSNGVILVSYK